MVSDTILAGIITGIAGIAGILATLILALSSKRSAERIAIIQLQSADSKISIQTLNSLFNSQEDPWIYAGKISEYLNSIDSAYLPDKSRDWATRRLSEFWDEYAKDFPDDTDLTEAQAQMDEDEYQYFYDDLDPSEQLREDFRVYRDRLRKGSTEYFRHAISGRPIKKHTSTKVKHGLARIPRRTNLKIKLGYYRLRERFRRKKPHTSAPVGPTKQF